MKQLAPAPCVDTCLEAALMASDEREKKCYLCEPLFNGFNGSLCELTHFCTQPQVVISGTAVYGSLHPLRWVQSGPFVLGPVLFVVYVLLFAENPFLPHFFSI